MTNLPCSISPLTSPRKRGFNLIEMAIVMGVVGMVLGGVWVAVAAVQESWRSSETVKGILYTVKNMQSIVSIANSEQLGNSASLTHLARSYNAFPQHWVQNGVARTPYNTIIALTNYANPSRFDFSLGAMHQTACVNILTKIPASPTASVDLRSISVWGPTGTLHFGTASFPITTANVQNACQENNHNAIYLTFKFVN